jgi:chitin disaccharide deacetylase
MKKITLCADDFGMTTSINQGILNLVENSRLSAISCMTNYPAWFKDIEKLRPYNKRPDLGLHFNIKKPLIQTISGSYLRILSKKNIEKELHQQVDNFIKGLQQAPAYIDGHQHIHALPVIRDIVTRFSENHNIPIRITENSQQYFKAKVINTLGGKKTARLIKQKNLAYNHDLLGIYPFNQSENYRELFCQWLEKSKEGSLIMCHPGVLERSRENELNYLLSQNFIDDLKKYQCQIL